MSENVEIRKALNFIKDNVITSSEWRRDGKPAHGDFSKWNEFRFSGKGCMLTISAETQKAIRKFISSPSTGRPSMYVLSDDGIAFLDGEETRS